MSSLIPELVKHQFIYMNVVHVPHGYMSYGEIVLRSGLVHRSSC